MTSHYNSQYNTLHSFEPIDSWLGKVVCKSYKIATKINEGSFGKIYKAIHQVKQDYYAIKVEHASKVAKDGETLLLEAQILYLLRGEKGFPRLFFYVQDGTNRILVETLLDRNLDELFTACNKRFSLKTVLLFLDQALNRLEFLHTNKYVHRDIKPENFMVGLHPEQDTIYLIDFGLSMRFTDKDGKHGKQLKGQHMVGTARFTPICSHMGMTQNRASDLESLGYLAIYFLKGSLPWMNIAAKTRDERFHLIGQKKMAQSPESLCQNLPQEFLSYFNYIFNLSFEQEPSYAYIRKSFRKLYLTTQSNEERFDWTINQEEQDNKTELIEPNKYLSQVISEQGSIYEKDAPNHQDSAQYKKEAWCKSNTTLLPNNCMKESKTRKTINYNQAESPLTGRKILNNTFKQVDSPPLIQNLQVMMERKDQHNSILSGKTDCEDNENVTSEEGNEYHPFRSMSTNIWLQKMMKIQTKNID